MARFRAVRKPDGSFETVPRFSGSASGSKSKDFEFKPVSKSSGASSRDDIIVSRRATRPTAEEEEKQQSLARPEDLPAEDRSTPAPQEDVRQQSVAAPSDLRRGRQDTAASQSIAERGRERAGVPQSTRTEEIRQQSLPEGARDQSPAEVEQRQSFSRVDDVDTQDEMVSRVNQNFSPSGVTAAEVSRQQSLSSGIRGGTPGEVEARQSLPVAGSLATPESQVPAQSTVGRRGTLVNPVRDSVYAGTFDAQRLTDEKLFGFRLTEGAVNLRDTTSAVATNTVSFFDRPRNFVADKFFGGVGAAPERIETDIGFNVPKNPAIEPILNVVAPQNAFDIAANVFLVTRLPVGGLRVASVGRKIITGGNLLKKGTGVVPKASFNIPSVSAKAVRGIPEATTKTVLKSDIVGDVVETGGTARIPKEQREAISKVGNTRIVIREGLREQAAEAKRRGLVSEIVEGISLIGPKDSFERGAGGFLAGQGITDPNALAFASSQKDVLVVTNAAQIVAIGKFGGEQTGRIKVAGAFKKSTNVFEQSAVGRSVAKTVTVPLVKAGIVEGSAAGFQFSDIRAETPDIVDVGIGAGAGGLSAGAFGTFIAGSKASRSAPIRRFGQTVEFASFVIDPGEKPGDIAEDVSQFVGRRFFGRATRTPAVQLGTQGGKKVARFSVKEQSPSRIKLGVPTFSNVFSRGGGGIPTPAVIPSAQQSLGTVTVPISERGFTSPVPISPSSQQNTFVAEALPVNIKRSTSVSVPTVPTSPTVPTFTDIPTGIPVNIPIPVDVPTNIPTDVPTDIPTDVPTDIPAFVPTNIPTNAFTVTSNINIPVTTPIFRFPAFAPLIPGGGGGGGRGSGFGRGGSKNKYVPSLFALEFGLTAKKASGSTTGVGIRPIVGLGTKTKRTRKKRAKKGKRKQKVKPFSNKGLFSSQKF